MSLNQDNNFKDGEIYTENSSVIISWKAKLDVNALYAISLLGQAATGLKTLDLSISSWELNYCAIASAQNNIL